MDFYKYHGLGNDYIVIDAAKCCFQLTDEVVRLICDRHYGVGSDGILLGIFTGSFSKAAASLRIYNPDGSEAEKSGNGLRIFAWFLYEHGYIDSLTFPIQTRGGSVLVRIVDMSKKIVEVDMGTPNFSARTAAPSMGLDEIVDQRYNFGIGIYRATFVSLGNPHCVIYGQPVNEALTRKIGPIIECSPIFPARVNVQFMEVISLAEIRIQIWERGAGYTMSSGSSSCAAVAAAHRMGLTDKSVRVHMPGGTMRVVLTEHSVLLSGPVEKVFEGNFSVDLMKKIEALGSKPITS